ncbi:alpha-galactosidase [Specibacter cremeus]|uniref:alpha-galactosidase n=1 Tax=Specibacter cremeus TaxID=1629051 RepID=UPI000F78356D|nr:alpha-galactosidase [Specibacter cremeus]
MTVINLRAASTSLVLDLGLEPGNGQPRILHWGADLGDTLPDPGILSEAVPPSALDVPVALELLPQASAGWRGRPGLRGHRATGAGFSPRLRLADWSRDGGRVEITQADESLGLRVHSVLTLHDGGLLEIAHTVTNDGGTAFALDELAAVVPVGPAGTEVLDLTGRWCRERHPQRSPLRQGTWVRSGRHGRTGHDAPLVMAVGSAGFGNRHGRVWAGHLGWSGNHESFVDTMADGRAVLGAAELLGSGEVVLGPGGSYSTPPYYAAYSDHGLDGITEAFYAWFRARDTHPATPRPVVLNTWEAVYFDHDLGVLTELAESAAGLGVERFVLDDGWFRHRRDDRAGLGDWYVDEEVWPEGLHPLADAVTGRGMQFGLWVEPEMVNVDSDLARAHPDWIAGPAEPGPPVPGTDRALPLEWRHQQVLDLVNPEAWQYIFERLDALLADYPIGYLKWDQNRDLVDLGHAGRPSAHEQTLAAYRLIDALRAAHPGVEIESCSSGGARVDLGILARTDRIWASDCNDALERTAIQRWTGLVVPPELVGSHIGPTTAHTTGRTHELSFRAITALFGHFGMEWDVRTVTGADREELCEVIGLYKDHRELLHTGRRVHADVPDPSLVLHGVVAGDGTRALFALAAVASSYAEQPGRVAIPGLDADTTYTVQLRYPRPGSPGHVLLQAAPPAWVEDGATATGRFLAEVGLPMPVLNPEHAVLLSVDS